MAFFVRWFMIICRSNMVMFQSKKMQENTIGLHHGISNYSSWFHHYFIDAPSGSLPEGTWDGSLQFVSWSSDEISEVSRDMDPQASLGWLISWNIHKWMSCESIMVSSCFDFMIHMILINDVAVRYIYEKNNQTSGFTYWIHQFGWFEGVDHAVDFWQKILVNGGIRLVILRFTIPIGVNSSRVSPSDTI